MVFLHAFVHSLTLPRKQSHFQLNRLGMDIAIIYILLLLLIVSFPAFLDQITNPVESIRHLNVVFLAIYFFIFYYIPLSIIVFISISLFAFIGKGITLLLQRKLHYSILWKLIAFSTTIPFLLYTFIASYKSVDYLYLFLAILFIFALLIRMILIYPKITS